MPLYYFSLKYGRHAISDETGEELADAAAARSHAETIAREIMQSRELKTRFWRIQVSDDYMLPLFEVYFPEVDRTLGHLPPEWRKTVAAVSRSAAHLTDALVRVQGSLAEVRATLKDADRLLTETGNIG